MRSCLTPEAARTISIELVTSKLDYCNSLLYGTSESNLNKLQRVQNDLARVVLRTPWRYHAAPLLRVLRWLDPYSIPNQIQNRPDDLQSMPFKGTKLSLFVTARLYSYSCVEIQRSISSGKPEIVHSKASRAFRHSAPVVWNSLSANTRCVTSPVSFKQLLKTELCAAAFGG